MIIKSLVNMINTTTPYAWDDSLTVYEFLGKIVSKLNEVVDEVNLKLPDDFETAFYEKFKEYTRDEMQRILESGEFSAILDSMIVEFSPIKQEVIDARDGEVSLGANITKVKSKIAENVQYIKYDSVSVKTFGAIGDGVTDETQSFIDAIAFCSANNKVLHIPQGIYLVSSTLEIPPGLTIYGGGGFNRRTVLNYTGSGALLSLNGGRYTTIEGICIQGGTSTSIGIYAYRPYTTLRDINIDDFTGLYGINLDGDTTPWGCWQSQLHNIRVVGKKIEDINGKFVNSSGSFTILLETGIRFGDNSNQMLLDTFTINYTSVQGILIAGGAQITIKNGNISEVYNKDTDISAIKINGGSVINLQDLYIENNTIGVWVVGGSGIHLSEVYMNGLGRQWYGFYTTLDGGDGLTLENCTLLAHTGADINARAASPIDVINCKLLSDTQVASNVKTIVNITEGSETFVHTVAYQPRKNTNYMEKTLTIDEDKTLSEHDSGLVLFMNPTSQRYVTFPNNRYSGLIYTIVNINPHITQINNLGVLQGFNDEASTITNSIKLTGLGSITIIASQTKSRWIVLEQKGLWEKVI